MIKAYKGGHSSTFRLEETLKKSLVKAKTTRSKGSLVPTTVRHQDAGPVGTHVLVACKTLQQTFHADFG